MSEEIQFNADWKDMLAQTEEHLQQVHRKLGYTFEYSQADSGGTFLTSHDSVQGLFVEHTNDLLDMQYKLLRNYDAIERKVREAENAKRAEGRRLLKDLEDFLRPGAEGHLVAKWWVSKTDPDWYARIRETRENFVKIITFKDGLELGWREYTKKEFEEQWEECLPPDKASLLRQEEKVK